MSHSELEHFVAIMDSGCDEVNDLDDLINLTYNLDNYDFIPDIKDYDDLGRYYFFEGGYNIDNKFGSFVDYIDFERYGEDCAINEGGTLTDAGYIRPTCDSWNRYFDGMLEDIPDEYLVTGSGEAFLAGALLNAVPGIIVQLVLIPAVMAALQKAGDCCINFFRFKSTLWSDKNPNRLCRRRCSTAVTS